jgi:hypothetical protein
VISFGLGWRKGMAILYLMTEIFSSKKFKMKKITNMERVIRRSIPTTNRKIMMMATTWIWMMMILTS